MISISRLLCDTIGPGDYLRYSRQTSPRPIVVWNCTRQCNLKCAHCYASAGGHKSPQEMDTASGKTFIQDIADYGVPVLLFSGGEPLLREDIFELADFAAKRNLRQTLSTNGTLITETVAGKLKALDFAEIGISMDGREAINDRFRGLNGAFQATLRGIRNCVTAGLRVSLRMTVNKFNVDEVPAIFKLAEEENIDRICFYHLVQTGRASSLGNQNLGHGETRALLDTISERTLDLRQRGLHKEVLTVGNHADGVYLYLKLKNEDAIRADTVYKLLETNGGNNSGIKISAVDESGDVHPDQFWRHYSLGNVLQRRFADIWTDTTEPLLRGLKDRQGLLKGRCGHCRYLNLCNGNMRVRAEALCKDVWAEDPACYLSDEEIGVM